MSRWPAIALFIALGACTPAQVDSWAAQALAERQACHADSYCAWRLALRNHQRDCELDIQDC